MNNNNDFVFLVESSVENKNEEEYFKEFIQCDDTETSIFNKLLKNDVPVFYAPVSIIFIILLLIK